MLNIVLVEPEIPQNCGNIARTCAATHSVLHLIRPLGFDISEKAVRRAGLDYWSEVDVRVYENLEDFFAKKYGPGNVVPFYEGPKGLHRGFLFRRLLPVLREGVQGPSGGISGGPPAGDRPHPHVPGDTQSESQQQRGRHRLRGTASVGFPRLAGSR